MRSILMSMAILLMTIGCSRHENPKPPAAQPQEAAANALSVLQKLVTAQNYQNFGFQSADEVKEAQLADPIQVYVVGLEKLKAYQHGTDVNSLLSPSPETIFPVVVRGNVRSSVTIVHKDSGYQPASFGNAPIVQALSRYRQSNAGPNEFVLRVPALSMYFLGRRVENRVTAVPIIDDPRIKVKAGEAVPLDTLLEQLRPLAEQYNGLPM